MDEHSLLIILLAGLCGPAFCFYREYYFVNTSLIWCDALTYCQNNYTNLVSIQSQNQSNQILSLAQNTFQDAAWVGLSRIDSQNWQWSDGSNVTYTNWERELFCAAVNADGTWTDFTCSTNFYFICYLDSGNTSRSFFLVRQSVTWYAAQQYCRSHYTNLVSIRNQAENEEVINSAQSFTVWTGLFNNPWKWSDGSRVTFFNWNTQEPNDVGGTEYCVQQFTSGFWNDITCNMNNPFVCCEDYPFPPPSKVPQGNKTLMFGIKIEKQYLVDLEVSAIRTNILDQIWSILAAQIPMDTMKMKWQESEGIVFKEHKEEKVCNKN
ncbi:macrophage mannose receptor 1-like isoform X3 [Polypterus senegalus]|uniref:macrophage mannose receptor 1-like isoform X3 n=1 Tax=Polypterus senegalus TaxID=55291 RepID=UPI0019629846|nr:macrophage mannose receptor 1-like isoform X3 [Polypterus senegalus]